MTPREASDSSLFAIGLLVVAVAVYWWRTAPRTSPGAFQEPSAGSCWPHQHDPSEEMLASWYGAAAHGRLTASGQPFNSRAHTCAHRTLPFGSLLYVEHGNRAVVLQVTDRGPMEHTGRDLDVSEAAAEILGFKTKGIAKVKVRRLV